MTREISGKFDVRLQPLKDDFGDLYKIPERMSIDKRYFGDLQGTGKGQMLSVRTAVSGSAGYVAIEVIKGGLCGRQGSFALQHYGMMDNGVKQLTVEVIPDSGTDELVGLIGTMEISMEGGEHFYKFNFAFSDDD